MAIGPITAGSFLMGGQDLAAFTNTFSLDVDVEQLEKTNFASDGWKEFVGGLKSGAWSFQGFLDTAAAEPRAILTNPSSADPGVVLGGTLTPIPVMAALTRPVADEDLAFLMRAIRTKVTEGAQVGQLAAYSLNLVGDDPMLRGQVLGTKTAVTTTGTTTGFAFGAVSATQKFYASLHVTSISAGDTLDVIIQSDDNSGFTSPITRVTFAQVTDATTHTYEYATPVAGAITDTWWRLSYTIGGVSPSFSFVVFAAIA